VHGMGGHRPGLDDERWHSRISRIRQKHQIMQKVEGKVSFHTAMPTAFPQPAPGTAPSAGPMKVPAEQLQRVLGITDVSYVVSGRSLAVVDSPLGEPGSAPSANSAGSGAS
jgi:hypothetical protein